MVVGAAGMLVELFLAALALFLWLDVEPGVVRAVLYNVMLIAGVSTVLFNANPLLRFDGYYMLADLLADPEPAPARHAVPAHLVERRLFGVRDAEFEATARERRWFVALHRLARSSTACSSCLRSRFSSPREYFVLGVVLAIWAVAASIVCRCSRASATCFSVPRLRRNRMRAFLSATARRVRLRGAAVLRAAIVWTAAEGVISVPEPMPTCAPAPMVLFAVWGRAGGGSSGAACRC